jgi:hypothetical protein
MSVCTSDDRNNSPNRGFVGSIAITVCRGYCLHVDRVVLIGRQGCRALIHEGPPLVFLACVLPVCVWCCLSIYAAPASLVLALDLKNGATMTGVTTCPSWLPFSGWWWHRQWRCRVLVAYHGAPSALMFVGGHKMHIFTANIPTFHSTYIK